KRSCCPWRDPKRLIGNALEKTGKINTLKSCRSSKTINYFRYGGITDGHSIQTGDAAIAINITVFDITSVIFPKSLSWRIVYLVLIYKQPFRNIAPSLIYGLSYLG